MGALIKIEIDDKIVTVSKKQYIQLKTKDLKEFGYGNLTEDEVEEQLEKILKGEELTVIGRFMENEIVKP